MNCTHTDEILRVLDKMRLELAAVGGRVATLQYQLRRQEEQREQDKQQQR